MVLILFFVIVSFYQYWKTVKTKITDGETDNDGGLHPVKFYQPSNMARAAMQGTTVTGLSKTIGTYKYNESNT